MKRYKEYQIEINSLEYKYQKHNLKIVVRKVLLLFRVRAKKPIWQWAEENIYLPEPIPGMFRIKNSSHLKEIFNAIQDPRTRTVTIMACAQSGKTLLMMIVWAYYVCEDPCNMLIMMPTDDFTKEFAEEKLDVIIENSKIVKQKVMPAKKGSKDSSRKTYKIYEGGWTRIVSAMKKGSTRMKTVRITITDEIDQHKPTVAVEGSVLDNLKTRSATFKHRALHLTTSTPRLLESSIVYNEYQSGSQEVYNIKCPHCGTVQAYEDKQLDCDVVADLFGVVQEYKTDTVYLFCIECKHKFYEYERKEVLRDGFYIAKHPERVEHRSFYLPQFSSPLASMVRAMEAKVKSKNSLEALESYYNNVLGLPFNKKAGESVDPLKLMDRREPVKISGNVVELCNRVLLVTCAVDVQRGKYPSPGRLEVEFEGWGKGEECWHLHKVVLPGNPREKDVWEKLNTALEQRFIRQDGVEIKVNRVFVDSGYAAQSVYEYCAGKYTDNIFAIKGSSNPFAPVLPRNMTMVNNELTGLLELGVNEIKGIISSRSLIDDKTKSGYIHFSENYCDSNYMKSYTAEHAVPKTNGAGLLYYHYERKEKDQPNEEFDLAVYNYSAMKHSLPDWDKLEATANRIAEDIAAREQTGDAEQIKIVKQSIGRKKLRRAG